MAMPTLKQLTYFSALRETLNFTSAAKRCHVTQSTLSAGIAELERLLGATLVERGPRAIRLTPAGEAVAARALRVLAEAEALVDAAQAAAAPLTGTLRLGVIPTIAPFLLPRALPRLRARYPELRLYLREELSGAACDALAKGALDAVLLALPWACGDIAASRLFDDPFHLAFAEGELDPPAIVDPATLDPGRLLLLEDGHCLKDQALAACGRPELRADAGLLGTSLNTLVQMVDNRLGMTLLPRMALDAGILGGTRVLTRPLSGAPSREIALVWRASSPRGAEFALLAGALADRADRA